MLNDDPFSMEAQQGLFVINSDSSNIVAIEEEIRMERVNENMELAMEDTPEAFGRVIMLYIESSVNNTPVKAFVGMGDMRILL